MSKISLDRLTSQFGFQAAFNSVLKDIEEEFSERVLYRNNPAGEVNNMNNDLDMSGNDIINVGLISADDFRVNGQDLSEAVNSLVDQIDDAIDEANAAVIAAEGFADEAESWANAAQVAATTVAYNTHEGTLLEGESVITLPWPYDVSVGVEVFLSGVKQAYSSLIFTDPTTVTLADVAGVLEDTPYEVVSTSRAQSQLGTQLADPNGSSLVGFLQDGTGATGRTVQDKLRDVVSVKDFGAVGDGVTDDTGAFSAAAKAATAGNPQKLQRPNLPLGDWAIVEVPSGAYLLSSLVDTGNNEIIWDACVDAVIKNPQNLNGRLWREGSKTTDYHHGVLDAAASFSVTANRNSDELAQISGFSNPNQLSKGNGRDSVACYFSNNVPRVTYGAASVISYSSTGASLSVALTSDQIKKLRKGMIVQTRHSPQKYAAMLDSWAADGSTITVSGGWYLVDGAETGTPTTPTGTDGLDINTFRKAWAINANVFIDDNSYGNAINTVEFGLINNKGEAQSRGGSVEANGVYSTNIDQGESRYGDACFLTGGRWTEGFLARSGCTHAFYYDGSEGGLSGEDFLSLIYGINNDGVPFFQVRPDGSVELGLRNSGVATPANIDFHSGAADSDYDARISCGGGTGSPLGGNLNYLATEHIVQGVPRPNVDAAVNFGRVDRRWLIGYFKEIRLGTGTAEWSSGAGSPEGVVVAAVGSMYTRTDGGAGTTLYVKESGTGNAGWVAK